MEFDKKKLDEWWCKISPEDQARILSKGSFHLINKPVQK
jgi:hypothetical protein